MQEFLLTHAILVPPELNGQRIDQVIAQLVPELSRRGARRCLADGRVFVDGRRVRTQGRLVSTGAALRIEPDREDKILNIAKTSISVLWKQDDLIAIAKPSGVPTEPTQQGSVGVASEQLKAWLRERGDSPRFLAAVHRLDVDTSGVVLFAVHKDAAARASAAFRQGQVLRRYLAVVDGNPEFETHSFQGAIARVTGKIRKYVVAPHGKASRTDVRVVAADACAKVATMLDAPSTSAGPSGALLYVEPYTGRTHQIRVHLADAGHPITGDTRYGAQRSDGFGLHASGLSLQWESIWEHIEAPVPDSFLLAAAAHHFSPDTVQSAARIWGIADETKVERCQNLI